MAFLAESMALLMPSWSFGARTGPCFAAAAPHPTASYCCAPRSRRQATKNNSLSISQVPLRMRRGPAETKENCILVLSIIERAIEES
ncbi:hypothetical protein B0H14DRAFT_2741326 [Mycena olivaceomarginata]|nr:hypothetical protein B0H14DRAFT_2741326 [Mycena olivaceomarginata]